VSNPRRRQIVLASKALLNGLAALGALGAAATISPLGTAPVLMMVALALVACWRARRASLRARRYGVGARSEAYVRRQLRALERLGWRVTHSVSCPRGDVDHVAVSPGGFRAAIETKTRRWEARHLRQAIVGAGGVQASPVLCVVQQRHLQISAEGVLVVSADRLVGALLQAEELSALSSRDARILRC
jgi:hypothetical protein